MAKVREATGNDIPALVELGRVMHSEAPALRHAPYHEGKVSFMLGQALTTCVIYLHEAEDGAVDGFFVGIVVERWFSRAKFASDLALFVTPDRRGGLIAYRLIDAFLTWCQKNAFEPRDVQLGITTGVTAEATGKLYERLGFERVGGIYQLRSY